MVDLTNLSGVDSMQELAYFTNNAVSGVLFSGGLMVFAIILTVILMKNDTDMANALAVSSWSFFVISSIFWLAHLVPIALPIAFVVVAAFVMLYLYSSRA